MIEIVICPGFHSPELTEGFLASLDKQIETEDDFNVTVFPTENYPAYSAIDICDFLWSKFGKPANCNPLVLIGFSAGVVGAVGAAWLWELQGGKVQALVAVDGWGVPLWGNFPIYRLSHDYFTHWSSALLGEGKGSFYAEPPVEHQELWEFPQKVYGWWIKHPGCKVYCCATEFLVDCLHN